VIGSGLALEVRHAGLPFEVAPPLAGCALGDRFHVVATDVGRGAASHVALTEAGVAAEPPRPLPLSFVERIAAHADGLVATGGRIGDEVPVVLFLGPDATADGAAAIPLEGGVVLWARPVSLGDRLVIAWLADADQDSILSISEVVDRECKPPLQFLLDGVTSAHALAGGPEGLTVARTAGGALELLRIADGTLARQGMLGNELASLPSLLLRDHGYAAVWVEGGRSLELGWLDLDLRPLGDPSTLARLNEGPTRFRSTALVGAASGPAAIAYQTATAGPGGTSAEVRHFLAPLQAHDALPGSFIELQPPGAHFDAAGWLGSTLVAVHGSFEPVVSIYRHERGHG
jgi:hypothetical protein